MEDLLCALSVSLPRRLSGESAAKRRSNWEGSGRTKTQGRRVFPPERVRRNGTRKLSQTKTSGEMFDRIHQSAGRRRGGGGAKFRVGEDAPSSAPQDTRGEDEENGIKRRGFMAHGGE